jgi:preprotein translocase subunit YajC
MLVTFGLLFVVFYFLFIRPQNKRAKEHRNMITSLKKGDEVITSGGILGKSCYADRPKICGPSRLSLPRESTAMSPA